MTIDVRIYCPSKSAMQSGKRLTKKWVMDFIPKEKKYIEPLMGWTGMRECRSQIKLHFSTLEEAIEYANTQKLTYEVIKPQNLTYPPKSYGNNFSASRIR